MDAWDEALDELSGGATAQERSAALDQITELLQKSGWQLPEGLSSEVICALRDRLGDANWCACRTAAPSRPQAVVRRRGIFFERRSPTASRHTGRSVRSA